MVTQASEINKDPGCDRTTDLELVPNHGVTMASGISMAFIHQHGHKGQPRPWTNGLAFGGNSDHRHQQKPSWTQTWALMAAQTTDICVALSGSSDHDHQHRPRHFKAMDPDMTLGSSPDLVTTIVSGGSAGHSHEHGFRLQHRLWTLT